MKIELKNIEIYDELTKGNIAFSADLYIEDKRAGRASNNGADEKTIYVANSSGHELTKMAKEYLKKLPPLIFEDKKTFKYPITIERNLENLIDELVYQHKTRTKADDALTALMLNCIVFGKIEEPLRYIKLKFPIADILKLPNGTKMIEKIIKERVFPRMLEGDTILNTNVPSESISLLSKIKKSITEQKVTNQKSKRNRKRGL